MSPQQVAAKAKRSHPTATTDKEPRKRKPPGRPRKHAPPPPPPPPQSPGLPPPPEREAATPDSAVSRDSRDGSLGRPEVSPGAVPPPLPPPPPPPPPPGRGRSSGEFGVPVSVNGRRWVLVGGGEGLGGGA